jgi:hypothetical protein
VKVWPQKQATVQLMVGLQSVWVVGWDHPPAPRARRPWGDPLDRTRP